MSVAVLGTPFLATADDDATEKRDRRPAREGRPARDGAGGEKGKRGERPDFASMSPEERLVAMKARLKEHPKMAEMLKKRFDKDEDGELSDEELTAAAKAMGKRRARGMKGEEEGGEKGEGKGPRGKREKRGGKGRPGSDSAES